MRKMHLSTLDKKIGGVCGGLGNYFTLDPLLFRIAFVVLAFTTFPAISKTLWGLRYFSYISTIIIKTRKLLMGTLQSRGTRGTAHNYTQNNQQNTLGSEVFFLY